MKKKKKISLEPIVLYRLLISNMRYAYTRNNHLTPSTAYEETKELLDNLIKADFQVGMNTAKQLLEECISDEIIGVFYDGLEDGNGNLKESLKFVDYLKDFIKKNGDDRYLPYNQDMLDKVAEKRKSLRYDLVRVEGDNLMADFLTESILEENLSENDAYNELFKLLGTQAFAASGTRSLVTKREKVCGKYFKISTPETHKGEIYGIIWHEKVIRKESEEEIAACVSKAN